MGEQQSKSLEALLATKNKRISEELTKIRVGISLDVLSIYRLIALLDYQILHRELEATLCATQEKLEATDMELEKQKTLNEKLENDLLSMNTANTDVASDPGRDLLTGLERSKKSAVSILHAAPRVYLIFSSVLLGIVISVNTDTIHVSGRYLNLANCDQSKGSV